MEEKSDSGFLKTPSRDQWMNFISKHLYISFSIWPREPFWLFNDMKVYMNLESKVCVCFSVHQCGRGVLCERRRAELQVSCCQNHLPLGPLQCNVRWVWTQPERDEIPSGGTEIHIIHVSIHQHNYRSRMCYQWSLSSAYLYLLFVLFQMQIYSYDPAVFPTLDDAVKGGGRIAALAVLFEVGQTVDLSQS